MTDYLTLDTDLHFDLIRIRVDSDELDALDPDENKVYRELFRLAESHPDTDL